MYIYTQSVQNIRNKIKIKNIFSHPKKWGCAVHKFYKISMLV